jgi:hypothetical protein
MVGTVTSIMPAFAALTLIVVTGAVGLIWLMSHFVIEPRSDDENDDGDGPGGGGGGGTGGGVGGPGRGGLESDPGPGPLDPEPEWWPEFERRLAEYSSSRPRPVRHR